MLALVLIASAIGLHLRGGLSLPARGEHGGPATLPPSPAASDSADPGPDLMPAATAGFHRGDDWRHLGEVIYYYRHHAASGPLVYFLGGSAARECTTSDASWRRQIVNHGGPATVAFNLGTSGQSYDDGINIVEHLPQEPSIIIIGVNLARYTHSAPSPSSGRLASAVREAEQSSKPLTTPYAQHRFTAARILSAAQKDELLTKWLAERYPVFQRQFAYNAERLHALVVACQARGFRPVLLNLPINQAIVGQRLDKPRAEYEADCRTTATTLGVPYVDWLARINLLDSDFADNWHLVEPGREKWQRRLTNLTINLLKSYHM